MRKEEKRVEKLEQARIMEEEKRNRQVNDFLDTCKKYSVKYCLKIEPPLIPIDENIEADKYPGTSE